MITLDDLTPEIKAKIPEYLAKARNFYDGSLPFDKEASTEYVQYIYELVDRPRPQVFFADGIKDYKRLHAMLCNEEIQKDLLSKNEKDPDNIEVYVAEYFQKLDKDPEYEEALNKAVEGISKTNYLWICNSYSRCYLTWYKFIADQFNLGTPELRAKLDKLYDLIIKSSIQQCFFQEEWVLVLKNPERVFFNERNQLHREDGPALIYPDYKGYFWKGGEVPEKLIMTPKEITKTDIQKWCDNAETRRAFIEVMGVHNYFNVLSDGTGLELVDEDKDGQGNIMKLYDFDFEGETVQVLEVVCPSTGRIYNLYPPSQNCKNVYEAKMDTFDKKPLIYRHGDVGLTINGYQGETVEES